MMRSSRSATLAFHGLLLSLGAWSSEARAQFGPQRPPPTAPTATPTPSAKQVCASLGGQWTGKGCDMRARDERIRREECVRRGDSWDTEKGSCVHVEPLPTAPTPSIASPAAPPLPPPTPPPPPVPPRSAIWWPAATLWATGAGLLAVGGGLGLASFAKKSELDAACGGALTCPASAEATWQAARSFAQASTGLMVAGGLLAAAGFVVTPWVLPSLRAQAPQQGVAPWSLRVGAASFALELPF